MSTLRKEFSVVGWPARVIAVVSYPVLAAVLYYVTGHDKDFQSEAARVVFSTGLSLLFPVMILLYGYVYGDAKRRLMRAWLWLLLAILIPNLIGVVLYFFMREPLPVACGACSAPVKPGFAFCPSCGSNVQPACPRCAKAVEPEWSNCAYCGAKLSGA